MSARQTIQQLIDDDMHICNEWTGELFLDILLDGATIPRRFNVIDYIGVKCSLHSLWFSEKKYPSNGIFNVEGCDLLNTDICMVARSSGYHLLCNCIYSSNNNLCRFFCVSGIVHQYNNAPCSAKHITDVERNSKHKCNRK